MLEQSDAGGGVEITAETTMELQDVMGASYAATAQALLQAHDDVVATMDDDKGERKHKKEGLEWAMRAESIALHDHKVERAWWYAAKSEQMPVKEQQAFAAEAKWLAREDAMAWLNEEIEQLHKKEGDAHEFHKWWHHLLQVGAKRAHWRALVPRRQWRDGNDDGGRARGLGGVPGRQGEGDRRWAGGLGATGRHVGHHMP
jgi:hypothetical protein